MSERKVLNKYYPPDFDPAKIPKVHAPKNKKFIVRLMAPCNMRCKTCGEYIYQGKKFNARKEDVLDMNYLGLRIYRFYIKCPKCVAEISFRTDPESTDYVVEAGATRNFEAVKLLDAAEKKLKKQREDEEANNPMKILENRTKDSKAEMDIMENIEELRELNTRQVDVDHFGILKGKEEEVLKRQEEEDEAEIRAIFGKTSDSSIIKRLDDHGSDDDDDDEDGLHQFTSSGTKRPTDFIHEDLPNISQQDAKKPKIWDRSVGQLTSKSSLSSLIRVKKSLKSNHQPAKPLQPVINSPPLPEETTTIQISKEIEICSVTSATQETIQSISKATVDSSAVEKNPEVTHELTTNDDTGFTFMANIKEGMIKKNAMKVQTGVKSASLSLLGGYSDSDNTNSDSSD